MSTQAPEMINLLKEALPLLGAFLAILGSVVLFHELGHLIVALALDVEIKELGIGLPPRMARLGKYGGIEITINWIPLGGFVRPAGEFDPSVGRGLAASPPLARVAVLVAGGLANIALTLSLFTAGFVIGWPDQVEVVTVEPGSPAESAGLIPGDRILEAGGTPIRQAGELSELLTEADGASVALVIARGDTLHDLAIFPRVHPAEGQGPAGFLSSGVIVRYGLFPAFGRASEEVADLFTTTVQLSAAALTPGGIVTEVRLAGPLGLKQASDRAVLNALDWNEPFPVIYLAGWLSLAVALTNLLPLPALDGGRILFVLVELARSRRIQPKTEKLIHALGMIGLLALMLALSARDVIDPLF